LKIANEHGYKQDEIEALLGMGTAYNKGNRQFRKAIEYFEKALKVAKEHEFKLQETKALIGLG
jgi:tetratricopeptide (TPR) repeat protein